MLQIVMFYISDNAGRNYYPLNILLYFCIIFQKSLCRLANRQFIGLRNSNKNKKEGWYNIIESWFIYLVSEEQRIGFIICLSVCLSVSLFDCLPSCLSVCLYECLFVCRTSVCPPVSASYCPAVQPSLYLAVCPSVYPSLYSVLSEGIRLKLISKTAVYGSLKVLKVQVSQLTQ